MKRGLARGWLAQRFLNGKASRRSSQPSHGSALSHCDYRHPQFQPLEDRRMLSIDPGNPGTDRIDWSELAPQVADQLGRVEVAALSATQSPVSDHLASEAAALSVLAGQPVDGRGQNAEEAKSLLVARAATQLPKQLAVGSLGVAASTTLVAVIGDNSRELELPTNLELLLSSDDPVSWLALAGLPTDGVDYTLRRTLRYRGDLDALGLARVLSAQMPSGRVDGVPKWRRRGSVAAVEIGSAQACSSGSREDGGVSPYLLQLRREAPECDPTWSSGKRFVGRC